MWAWPGRIGELHSERRRHARGGGGLPNQVRLPADAERTLVAKDREEFGSGSDSPTSSKGTSLLTAELWREVGPDSPIALELGLGDAQEFPEPGVAVACRHAGDQPERGARPTRRR